jgi:hypothetical protein
MPSPRQPANLFGTLLPDLENDRYPHERPTVGKRAFIPLLIILCVGIGATLAWQLSGDREMIASSHPQLSGLAPQAERVAQNAADVIGLASRTASSPDQQQPNAIDLDVVRESIDRIATSIASSQGRMTSSADRMATTQEEIARSADRMATTQEEIARSVDRMLTTQEQLARSVDQLRADQEQMTREITKLQEIGQSIRVKNSESSPPPASAPKPVSPTLPEPTASWPGPINSEVNPN